MSTERMKMPNVTRLWNVKMSVSVLTTSDG